MRISDWSSDVCSSDLVHHAHQDSLHHGSWLGCSHGQFHTVNDSCSLPCQTVRHSRRFLARFHYPWGRSEEHTSELQSLMRSSYAVFCLKKKKMNITIDKLTTN